MKTNKNTRKVKQNMKLKNIIAVAAVAVATVAGASTNYVEQAQKHQLYYVVKAMERDPAFAEPSALRTAIEELDRDLSATNCIPFGVSRRCPLTAKKVLERRGCFSERVVAAMLAGCGYDAENRFIDLQPGEAGYANFALQAACGGTASALSARNGILNAAVVPARRMVRAEGGTFVGKEGAAKVRALLDALANELNAPRFGNAGAILARLGMEVEWEHVQSLIPGEKEVAELKAKLLGGEIAFSTTLQNKLCIALGVTAYNEFVREYNGK